MKSDKEAQLLYDLKNKNNKDSVFKTLLDLYQERLYWHIRKIVITHENANDVLQNTFIRIYRNIKSFKFKSSLYTWLYKIAYNESIRFVRKNKIENNCLSELNNGISGYLQQDYYFDGNEVHLMLHGIIWRLTEKQRMIFQMKYFDELSFKQISKILHISENTLKSSYYSTVKTIEKKITESLNY